MHNIQQRQKAHKNQIEIEIESQSQNCKQNQQATGRCTWNSSISTNNSTKTEQKGGAREST